MGQLEEVFQNSGTTIQDNKERPPKGLRRLECSHPICSRKLQIHPQRELQGPYSPIIKTRKMAVCGVPESKESESAMLKKLQVIQLL